MELIGALAAGVAVFAALMALLPSRARTDPRPRGSAARGVRGADRGGSLSLLGRARLEISPRSYLALSVAAPVALGLVGLWFSVRRWGPRAHRRWPGPALVRPVPRGLRGTRRGRRCAAGPARHGQPGSVRRHVSGPVRGGGRGGPPPLGEGRLRGDPRSLLRERAPGRGAGRRPPTPGGAEASRSSTTH